MNKSIIFIQLLFLCGIYCFPFSTPEECLKQIKCKDNDLNCVASCYNVPSPDRNSIVKTADCQNGCLAKYPNNVPTDWANLNQCYLDCVQDNYFNSPAEYIAATTENNNSNTSANNDNKTNNVATTENNNSKIQTTSNNNKTNEDKLNNNNSENTLSNNNSKVNNTILSNGSNLNQTNSNAEISHPINATDHLPSIIVQENSYMQGYAFSKIYTTIAVLFLVYLVLN